MAHELDDGNGASNTSNFDLNMINSIREEFYRENSVGNAIRILDKLVEIPVDVSAIDESEYWPDICDLLTVLLKTVSVDVMLREYQIVVLSLINKSPQRFVQIIADDYFKPAVIPLKELFKSTALAVLVAMARRIKGQICAESVANFLCHFVDTKEVMQELLTQLEGQEDAEQRFRVYQVAISAMLLNNFTNYDLIRPIINALINEINEEQILTSITALEILSDVTAAQKQSATFLGSIGLLDRIYALFEKSSNNPDGGLIHSVTFTNFTIFLLKNMEIENNLACIRFFGYLTHTEPNALVRYPLFAREIFDTVYHFDLVDATRRQLGFDTLAMITTNSQAKQFLCSPQCPYNMRKAMNHFGVAIVHSPDDLRVRLLGSLRVMMDASSTVDDSGVLRDWFNELGEPFPTVLLTFLRKPFEDVKIASFELLETIFRLHNWSIVAFNKVNGFMEFLIDRKPGDSAQVWQLKYDVVCRILDSDPLNILNEETVNLLQQYRTNGVYFTSNEETSVDWGSL